MRVVAYFILLFVWVSGVVLAQGFWSTVLAIVIPFWAWYLFVERVLQMCGMIP